MDVSKLEVTASEINQTSGDRKLSLSSCDPLHIIPLLVPILNHGVAKQPGFELWADAKKNDIAVARISGAMTNKIFVASLKGKESSGSSVLVRVYGKGTDAFFAREKETRVFNRLCGAAYGSHAMLCEFANGRCERFFSGFTPVEAKEMREPQTYLRVAEEARVFHGLTKKDIIPDPPPSYQESIHEQMVRVRSVFQMLLNRMPAENGATTKQNRWVEDLTDDNRKWLDSQIAVLPSVFDAVEKRLREGHSEVVLGHNDMQPNNILAKLEEPGFKGRRELRFIDFEYTDYIPRGYDLANCFCEWAADYHGPTPHIMDYNYYPSPKQQRDFCRAYLAQSEDGKEASHKVLDEQVEGLVEETKTLKDLSHVWWGVWALLQETQSNIEFDYIGYAKCRLDQIGK